MKTLSALQKDFRRLASPARAKSSQWFFKTEPGQYGHGDKFMGVTVPEQRQLAKKYRDLPLADVIKLLRSPWHEHRLTAVIILDDQFHRHQEWRQKIFRLYLANTQYINNWDIVDSSAPHIIGTWLLDKPRTILYRLTKSKNIWERRIAIIATQALIRDGQYQDTLKIAKILLTDRHDLIHKAVGWMLRVVGDMDRRAEEKFLKRYASRMPRTMLRYAVEKFPIRTKKQFMAV